MRAATAYVLLEDGTRFDGIACGAGGHAVGEVVFTTGMSGYQESMTDPSFAGQLIAFTYPHIGNYGVSAQAMESERPWARAAIMREACDREDSPGAEGGWLQWLSDCGVPAISGVDTRALVIHIRDRGAMRGGVFPASMPEAAGARPGRGRAADGRPGPGGAGDPDDGQPPRREQRGAAHRGARHGHQGLDGPRAARTRRARDAAPVHDHGLRAARGRSRRGFPRQRPRRPGGAGLRRARPSASCSGASRCGASAWATSCCAGPWACRRSSCPSATTARTTPSRTCRRGASRSPPRTTASRCSGPSGSRTDRRARGRCAGRRTSARPQLSHVNLYDRTVEGFELLDVSGRGGAVPPRGGPGTARQPVPVRPLPGAHCRGVATSTRS